MIQPHRALIRGMIAFLCHSRGTALIEFAFTFPVLFLLVFGGVEMTRYILIQHKVEKGLAVVSSIATQETPAVAATPSTPASGMNADDFNNNIFPNFNSVMGGYGCCTSSPSDAVIITSIIRATSDGADPTCTSDTDPNCVRVQWQIGYVQPGADTNVNWVSAITGIAASDNADMAGLCQNVTDPTTGVLTSRTCHPPKGVTASQGTLPLTTSEQTNINAILPGENLIVTEVFYEYEPLIEPLLKSVGTADKLVFFLDPVALTKRTFAHPRIANLPDLPPNFPAVP